MHIHQIVFSFVNSFRLFIHNSNLDFNLICFFNKSLLSLLHQVTSLSNWRVLNILHTELFNFFIDWIFQGLFTKILFYILLQFLFQKYFFICIIIIFCLLIKSIELSFVDILLFINFVSWFTNFLKIFIFIDFIINKFIFPCILHFSFCEISLIWLINFTLLF